MNEFYDVKWSNDQDLTAVTEYVDGFFPSNAIGYFRYRAELITIPQPYTKFLTESDYITINGCKFSVHYTEREGILEILKRRMRTSVNYKDYKATPKLPGLSPLFNRDVILQSTNEWEVEESIQAIINRLKNKTYLSTMTEMVIEKDKKQLEDCYSDLIKIRNKIPCFSGLSMVNRMQAIL